MDKVNKFYGWIDGKLGPDRQKNPRLCNEGREMILDCVLNSKCFKKYGDFKYCLQEGIDKPCKALRYDYYRCKRSAVYWEKSITRDPGE